jgi:cell division protein FtsB
MRTRLFRILLLIIILFSVYKFYENYRVIKDLEHRIMELEGNIVRAMEEKNRLEEELENVNNPEYIEKIAREELGLVKPGELLIIPVEETD